MLCLLSICLIVSLTRRRRRARTRRAAEDTERAATGEAREEACDVPDDAFGRGLRARLSEDGDPNYDLHGLGHVQPHTPTPPPSSTPVPPVLRRGLARLLSARAPAAPPQPEMTQRVASPTPSVRSAVSFVPRFFPPTPAPPAPPPYVPPPTPLREAPPGYGEAPAAPLNAVPPPFSAALEARARLAPLVIPPRAAVGGRVEEAG